MESAHPIGDYDIPLERRYSKELPRDKDHLAKARRLLEAYSGIPPDEIEKHVTVIVSVRSMSPQRDVVWRTSCQATSSHLSNLGYRAVK